MVLKDSFLHIVFVNLRDEQFYVLSDYLYFLIVKIGG